ncbi:uncharacterized protein SCHCODRAFT_02485944 [Schizophyllum commune H4-8]|nr:uncharacterized protein SCHCODRAFT_02485944 [Schizophyllum commune H4-8]KAI5899751.1 hypothetical protein SCHCODRAFT_02485944 [Schizophyllum commune H4-8]
MAIPLPHQLLLSSKLKRCKDRERARKRRLEAAASAGSEEPLEERFLWHPKQWLHWVHSILAILFTLGCLIALYLAAGATPSDLSRLILVAAVALSVAAASAVSAYIGKLYRTYIGEAYIIQRCTIDWPVREGSADDPCPFCGMEHAGNTSASSNKASPGPPRTVFVRGTGIRGPGPGRVVTTLRVPDGTSARTAMKMLRERHAIADLEHIKPYACIYSQGSRPRILADKSCQEAVLLEAECTLEIRYRVLGGMREESDFASRRAQQRFHPADFRPHQRFKAKDPRVWECRSYEQWHCKACDAEYASGSIHQHEKSQKHQQNADAYWRDHHAQHTPSEASIRPSPAEASLGSREREVLYDRMRTILDERANTDSGWNVGDDSGAMEIDWDADAWKDAEQYGISYEEREVASLASDLRRYFDGHDAEDMPDLAVDSDDEDAELDGVGEGNTSDDDEDDTDNTTAPLGEGWKRQRAPIGDEENPWYPWPDKETCIVDILRHIPRCSFSAKQNQVIHWAMTVLGLDNVPTQRSMKDVSKVLQSICGIESLRFVSAFGNIYYTNDVSAIIAQEMANLRVRRHLHFLPEKTNGKVSEAWHASRWLDELDPALLTQSIRKHNDQAQEFFVFEPSLLMDLTVFMPVRWYLESGVVHARGWRMTPDSREEGWIVHEQEESTISERDLFLSLPTFAQRHRLYNLPSPNRITVTPLEMADGIVDQIRSAQEDGIWAWDAEEEDYVLVIPSVFAMLGDNPMQSEMCCHSGLMANHFCRACWVEGEDVENEAEEHDDGKSAASSRAPSPDSGRASPDSVRASPGATRASTTGARTRKAETLDDMISRLDCMMSMSQRMRTKSETLHILHEQFSEAKRVGGKTALGNKRTATGIKDSYQSHFLDKLTQLTTKKGQSKAQKQAAVTNLLSTFPESARMLNPLLRLPELDAHADTPVEILHVILLGIVKYFWRDVINNRLKTPAKEILKSRLDSFDTSGLGIAPLSGDTLVDYAGSLVGRDFRAIAQVAPFVLCDLGLSADLLDIWSALGMVVPMVWQPEIDDMDVYLVRLRAAIRYLLDCTCKLDAQWFNKPKFHMLIHLPEHIRRFGPAMLFATEGFESFNAIIRAHSIHSNRHAPSRDIARSMAQSNRIRHLLSGGYFRVPNTGLPSSQAPVSTPQKGLSPWMSCVKGPEDMAYHWRAINGPPLDLIRTNSFAQRFLAFADDPIARPSFGE